MHYSPDNYKYPILAKARTIVAKAVGTLKEAGDGPVRLGAPDTYKHFRGITQAELQSGQFTRPITVTDIETGNNDQVISVAAIKGVIDTGTGEFRVLDTLEKYYTPEKTYSQSFNMSREVHGLTGKKIESLRQLQSAAYSEKYDQQEAADLLKFMHGSLIVGHNVEEFDFTRLGIASKLQGEDILDTLVWAENAGVPRGKRGLSKMFRHYTGRSLKAAGYSHHFGFHDVLSNVELLSALYMQEGRAGRDLRFVANHKGFSYGAYEGAAGTAIIKGGYYKGRGPGGLENYMYEDEFDENGVFEYDYDENGRRVLPDGYSEEEARAWEDPEELGLTQSNLFRLEADDTFKALREEMARVRETMLGYSVSQKQALVRYLAGKDIETGREYLKGLKYKDEAVDDIMRQVLPLRIDKERKEAKRREAQALVQREKASSYIDHMFRKGDISENDYRWLSDVNTEGSGFSPQDIIYMARENRDVLADRRRRVQEHRVAQDAATLGELNSFARDLNEQDTSPFDRDESFRKSKYLDKIQRKKLITEEQRASLDLVGSYDDLVDATESVIESNERLLKIYEAIGKIRPYDINQLISSAKNQWGGIMSSSKGVIPNFIRNPIGRLGDAAFNSIDSRVAPWNAFNRVWNSGIGQTLTTVAGAFGGIPGMMIGGAVSGGVSALSQIVGNVTQAKMETRMLGIQQNLNTLGAMISWISTPFQMLHKAIKLVTGAFGGLSLKLNNIMGGGIGMMSQLGNPLEELTGVNYLDYQRAGLVDMASLLRGGSTNTAIEQLAIMQRDLYRYGKVDTDKMIAANMLGVFGEAFTPTTDAAGTYYSIANKILSNLKSVTPGSDEERNIMYYVNKLNPTLAQTIRSANLLGVSDIRQLANPDLTGNRMYWRPITQGQNGEEAQFRRTQFEYGVATQQFGYSKMRLADRLWNAVGRDLYNGINRVVDALADGRWKDALNDAGELWESLKEKGKKVWEEMNEDNKLGETLSKGLNKGLSLIKEWGWKVSVGIIDIWNQIFGKVLEKSQGLIAYLSTIKVGLDYDKKTKQVSFNFGSIKDYKPQGDDKIFNANSYRGSIKISGPLKGKSEIAKLARVLYPDASDEELYDLTVDNLKQAWVLRGNPSAQLPLVFPPNKSDNAKIFNGAGQAQPLMEGAALYAREIFPDASVEQLASLTLGDLKREYRRRDHSADDITEAMFGVKNLQYTWEDANYLLDFLGMKGADVPLADAAATYAADWNDYTSINRKEAYDSVGIMPMYEKMTKTLMEDIIPTIEKRVMSKDNEINIEIVNKEGKTSVDVNGRTVVDSSGIPVLSQMVLDGTKISASKRN